jgi:hypothetical protein
MINLRFGIPLFFIILHQHVANSAFGLNNPIVPLTVFFLVLSSMCIFMITNNCLGYSKFIAVLFLFFFLGIWLLIPTQFKDISSLYINFFITFYIIIQRGFLVVKNQLVIIVIASAVVGLLQIWGLSPLVHEWNSQFLEEKAGYMVRNLEVRNIIQDDLGNTHEYDSRQVRPPGIFHSSALVSGIFVMYISFVFIGIYKSIKNYFFVPFLCVLSGSKLVLLATLLFFVLSIFFYRLSFRKIFVLTSGSIVAVFFHKFMFNSLLDFQFNTFILFYSFDIRLEQYAWELADLESILPKLYLMVGLVIGLILINKVFQLRLDKNIIFVYTLLIIAISASFFATPHIANFLFGWFYFPAFFAYQHFERPNESTKVKDKVSKMDSFELSS